MSNKNARPETNDEYHDHMELIQRYSQSGGSLKLWNYFVEISKTAKFRSTIRSLKEKYQIPIEGLPMKKNSDLKKYRDHPGYVYKLSNDKKRVEVCIDGYLMPPDEWLLKHTEKETEFDVDVMNLCSRNWLHWLYWQDVIKFLVFYNKLHRITDGGFDLCMIADLRNEKEEPFNETIQAADDDAYPIALRISPYASQRDIVDYIKRNYKSRIEPSQKHYRDGDVKIGKVRRKKKAIQERNDFIFQNRELPRREIMTLVKKKYGEVLDYGLISKIISLEKKKRKDV